MEAAEQVLRWQNWKFVVGPGFSSTSPASRRRRGTSTPMDFESWVIFLLPMKRRSTVDKWAWSKVGQIDAHGGGQRCWC